MKTLYGRLVISFLLIVSTLMGAVLLFSFNAMREYYDEITQKVNQTIAMYVGNEYSQLSKSIGSDRALQTLGNHAMVINPNVEVYLLDRSGNILTHSLGEQPLARDSVDTQKLQRFIDGNENYPIRAGDPRHADIEKIFSAQPVELENGQPGFVYVVLGGETYDSIVMDTESSFVAKTLIWGIAALLLIGFLLGALVFSLLVKRLTRLSKAMSSFSNDNFDLANCELPALSRGQHGDEIDKLGDTFVQMASTISLQMTKLRESDRLRRELISNVSHDLRTPLATTQGYIDTLYIKNDQLDKDERKSFLSHAQSSVARLRQLIDSLFELSTLETGQIKPVLEQFSILELMYDTAQDFSLEASKKNIEIRIPSPEKNTMVHADLRLIQRVLENLLKNAMRYTPDHGEISLAFNIENERVIISVEDTGQGIPQKDLPHIFDRFYRVNQTGDKGNESTGLGLAIVKRILEMHSSKLTVRSVVDQGSSFSFDLEQAHYA